MATYTLKHKETGDEHEEFFTSYSKLQEYLTENPQYETIIRKAPALFSGNVKIDSGFKDVLSKIKEGTPGNNIEIPSHSTVI